MIRLGKTILCLIALLGVVSTGVGQEKVADKAVFDVLVFNDGRRLEGLVLEETGRQIRFQFLVRKPGVRTLVFETVYERGDIASIQRASEPGRTVARQMVQHLETGKKQEEARLLALPMQGMPWITGQGFARHYVGQYFELVSDAEDRFVRLVVVRLESMFGAYLNTLGKRLTPVKPVRIVLFQTLAEFRDWQRQKGVQFLNPAVYDARAGEILVGSDLQQQAQQLDELTRKHKEQLSELAESKKKIDRHYSGQTPAILARQMQQTRQQLEQLGTENEAAYARLQASFFATLYHEAFHAYLDHWVFPSEQYHVPRWLNEGLAQLFENAFVEIDELRPGRIDEKRLQEIQEAVSKGRFMTIREILQSPAQTFFVRHTKETFEADRHYNACWTLAHFLTYDLKLLTSPAMVAYVQPGGGGDEIKRFEKLVGMPLEQCEERWRTYLLRLRPDGSLRP